MNYKSIGGPDLDLRPEQLFDYLHSLLLMEFIVLHVKGAQAGLLQYADELLDLLFIARQPYLVLICVRALLLTHRYYSFFRFLRIYSIPYRLHLLHPMSQISYLGLACGCLGSALLCL